jgi:ankyrin repeat protein
MFFRSLQQVAEDDAISHKTRANAYLQLCYANIDSFGTVRDFGEAIKCLKSAANLGSTVAASILRPLILATGQTLDPSLEKDLKRWLVTAVEAGSLLARDGLRILDEELSALKNAEEPLKLFMGAKLATPEGVATADLIETFFLPANLGVMKMLLGTNKNPMFAGMNVKGTFMSRSMNTYLHAGAALGVDPDHFRNVISVADTRNINAQDDIGNTPLHLAMRFGNVEVAQILLEHGARASLPNKRGETPWHWLVLVKEADIDELALLMSEDTDGLEIFSMSRNSVNDQYAIAHGGTALHWAVEMRAPSAALTLLSYGADPLIKCRGLSPLDLAIKDNAAELLEVFLDFIMETGLDFSPQCTLIDLATGGNPDELINVHLESVDTLLLQATFIRPLHERLIDGGMDWLVNMRATLRILHENGYLESWSKENNQARLEALRMSSLSDASWTELIEAIIVTAEILPGCSVEDNKRVDNKAVATFWNEALKDMLQSGQPVAIHFAIDKIRKYSSSSRLDDAEALLRGYCSSLTADVSVVESILKDCADVDCADEEGRTPLMKAVRERNFEIATYLLDRGADVNRTWSHEGKPVHILYEFVVNNTDIDVVPLKYLLEPMHPFLDKIPPFFIGPTQEDTILHQACKDGNPVIVDYLLSKFGTKDHLDRRGAGGFTALHHAVFNGHASLAMKLCRAGSDVNARSGTADMPNRQRSRPLDLCFRWWTQSTEFLSHKFGLERTREDVLIGRLSIAEYLVRRHQARRASRSLVHRSLALKLTLGAAEHGMTKLLAVALRLAKKEMDTSSHRDVDYSLLLSNLLWITAPRGHVNATRLLLNLRADVKQRSVKGRSLLHVVSWVGKAEMVYVLVKSGGADINVEDAEGETPASYSVKSKNLATIRMVKSLGGLMTLPRERMMEIMRNIGMNTSVIPLTFNPRFAVRFGGEPSDDELSDERSAAQESEDGSTNKDDEKGVEVVKKSVADAASGDEGPLDK